MTLRTVKIIGWLINQDFDKLTHYIVDFEQKELSALHW